MSIEVAPADPRGPDARALLAASHALMQRLFPPEDNHYLTAEELAAEGAAFFLARDGRRAVGCGALARRSGYGELKAMYVDEAARGQGIGAALLARLEAEARALGLPVLRLETGCRLEAAHRLYARHGFVRRGPFGVYTANATSLFMEKRLGAGGG